MKQLLILLAILCSSICSAQWVKMFAPDTVYYGLAYKTPVKTVQLKSGDLISPYNTVSSNIQEDPGIFCLAKDDGKVKWRQKMLELDEIYDVIATPDGGFTLAAKSTERDIYDSMITKLQVIKFDADGNLLWRKFFAEGYFTKAVLRIMQNDAGRLAVAGGYANYINNYGVFYTVDGATGATQVSKKFANYYFSYLDTAAGNYYCYSNYSDSKIYHGLFQLNSSGDSVWKKSFDKGYCQGILSAADGSCIISLYDSCVKLDRAGKIIWSKPAIRGVLNKAPGKILAASVYNTIANSIGKFKLMEYSLDADSLKRFFYPDTVLKNPFMKSAVQASDNSFIICGTVNSNMVVFKTDNNGALIWKTDTLALPRITYPALQQNNYKLTIGPYGNVLNDLDKPLLVVPAEDSIAKSTIMATGLFMGAKDNTGNIYTAIKTYDLAGKDYWPGPFNTGNSKLVNDWDKVWLVNRSDIRTHILDFIDNRSIDNGISSIFDWPGKGNVYAKGRDGLALAISSNMAPFVDRNHNDIYEPNLGEYPDIKGDGALFYIFNDSYSTHQQSTGMPMNAEIRGMAYAYNCPDSTLFNTFFTEFTVTNKSSFDYSDFYFGQWADFDIGCWNNDRYGCDSAGNVFYAYNGTSPDLNCILSKGYGTDLPVQSATFLDRKMYSHGFGASANPQTNADFYNVLSATWADSIGRRYIFNGNPADTTQSSECVPRVTQTLPPSDRRSFASSGPYYIPKDSSFSFAMSYTFHPHMGPPVCFDYNRIRQQLADLAANYQNGGYQSCVTILPTIPDSLVIQSGIKEELEKQAVFIFPNPASSEIFITTTNFHAQDLRIYDIGGQVVQMQKFAYRVNINSLPAGIYILQIKGEEGMAQKRFVKLQ